MTPYELGESGSADAIPHLLPFISSRTPNDVRLAASAIGKLSARHKDSCNKAVPLLIRALNTDHPQVRQYILKALSQLDVAIQHIDILKTIASHDDKEYNRGLAMKILSGIDNASHGGSQPPRHLSVKDNNTHVDTPSRDASDNIGLCSPITPRRSFTISLTGEQKRILALPFRNPILIKGVAGSGKTTIAIYRARHIIESDYDDFFRSSHVCIISYTNSLVKYINSIISLPQASTKITVTTFHKWAYGFLADHGFWNTHVVAERQVAESIIATSLSSLRISHPTRTILQKTVDFYLEEFSWLKGHRIFIQQDYFDAKRTGRGTSDRVTSQNKELIWNIYVEYCKELQNRSAVDFDDFANVALQYIEKDAAYIPPFSHLVIDEAQDLTASQLLVLTKLVKQPENSITIIADAAQRIFKSGFAWADVGINVRGGRSVELKNNYRNTRQIAEAAISLLTHDPQKTEYSEHVIPNTDGPFPVIVYTNSTERQVKEVLRIISNVNLSSESAVILHRRRKGAEYLSFHLQQNGYSPTSITDRTTGLLLPVGLYTCTMSSIKGLEFDHVVICDLNNDIIPCPSGFADDNDDFHISTERRLLYTSMTRSRRGLFLITTGTPTRYLQEIDQSKVKVVRYDT